MEYHPNPNFQNFIFSLFEKCELSDSYVKLFSTPECMKEYAKCFTHESYNKKNNYEYYEILGDATSNKIAVTYYHKRFNYIFEQPGEGNMGPVAIMARLKQMGVSKRVYSKYAKSLGFYDFILCKDEPPKFSKEANATALLEDTFEAFIGCLECIVDKHVPYGGYGICYIFMKKLMDNE